MAASAGNGVAGLETTIVYRSVSPLTSTPPLRSRTVFTTVSLAGWVTVSTSVEELFAGVGSVVPAGAVTVAVLTSIAVAAAVVMAVTV